MTTSGRKTDMRMEECAFGIIGLGQMGGGIAANVVRAGYSIIGYDLKPDAIQRFTAIGGKAAKSGEEIVEHCNVILTCMEGRDSISVADTVLLPNARTGQVFVDHSTIPVQEACRIGQALHEASAQYLDAPISGGKSGAEAGTLRIFVGGDKTTAEQYWPLFEAIGNTEKVVYCGPTGMGQAAKVVQQLTTRFPAVARLEVMTFGLRAGLDLDIVMRALDVSPDSSDAYARFYKAIKSGDIEKFSFEYAEWGYFLEAARAMGFRMPMLEAMYEFCKDGEKIAADAVGRPEPSVWNELMKSS